MCHCRQTCWRRCVTAGRLVGGGVSLQADLLEEMCHCRQTCWRRCVTAGRLVGGDVSLQAGFG
ncbi:hypothetical protein LEMLEM_LOCUS21215, partial [Lemmus lemmus]